MFSHSESFYNGDADMDLETTEDEGGLACPTAEAPVIADISIVPWTNNPRDPGSARHSTSNPQSHDKAMSATISADGGPIFFWMPHEHPYGFLSQWYPAPFTAPSLSPSAPAMSFLTTEQYMMYRKAMLFGDSETAKKIMTALTPAEHKALGRQVKSFDKEKWVGNRNMIVEEGNWNKFRNAKEGPRLRELLLETGERELVEVCKLSNCWILLGTL